MKTKQDVIETVTKPEGDDTLAGAGYAATEGDAIGSAGLAAIPYLAFRWAIGKYRKGHKR